MVTNSIVSFVVRPGNPKHITTWADLVKSGVQVITPNVFSSGSAKWNIMAAYGAQIALGKTPAQAQQYLSKLLHNAVAQPSSASAALQTFLSGQGDVLLDYEDDALYAKTKGEPVDVDHAAADDPDPEPDRGDQDRQPRRQGLPRLPALPRRPDRVGPAGLPAGAALGGGQVQVPPAEDALHHRPPGRLDIGQQVVLRPPDRRRRQGRAVARRLHRERVATHDRRGRHRRRPGPPGRGTGVHRPPPGAGEGTVTPLGALPRPGAAGRVAWRASGPALAVTYLSLLVLLPLAALFTNAFSHGWGAFWAAVTQPEAVAALELTLGISFAVAVVNSVAGLAIAWVLVRDDFRGKALVGAVIDLPFALPTIVAGLTLLALYGPNSPFHVNLAGTRLGIACALAFVTLPFCVRSVQPVLAELDAETEEAASSLGASHRQVLRRVILPSSCRRCWPAPASPSPGPSASSARSC